MKKQVRVSKRIQSVDRERMSAKKLRECLRKFTNYNEKGESKGKRIKMRDIQARVKNVIKKRERKKRVKGEWKEERLLVGIKNRGQEIKKRKRKGKSKRPLSNTQPAQKE